jgi:uracil-DNA glycosylase family 4
MNAAEQAFEALAGFWEEAGLEVLAPAPAPWSAATAAAAPAAPAARPISVKPAAPALTGPAEEAQAAAAKATDLPALFSAIEAFNGCALKKGARRTVVADGVAGAPILIIGEAPGADEDAVGKPFVGRAGQLLDRMLGFVGVSRLANCLISNCVYWRPPGNRNPTPEELTICRPFVERMIALSQPKLLVLIGGIAGQFISGRSESVTRLRGQRLALPIQGLTTPVHAMVMLHPAYLLRQPAQKRLAWADLLAASAWLDELEVKREPSV